jgi:protein-tyrosine phosphatase
LLESHPLFVDIHNHLLPGVDDGAANMAETLEMARRAVTGGTDTMVATPHRAWVLRRNASVNWVTEQVTRVQDALHEAAIPLTVLPGVELQIGPRLAEELSAGEHPTLNHGKWVLIEPPFDHIPHDALDHLKAVRDAGFSIVLAHPERSREIQNHLAFVEACADLGMTFQLTTGSILGHFGEAAQKTAFEILTHHTDWPIVIASDMHDLGERPPDLMAAARDAAVVVVGEAAADAMVNARPRAIVLGTNLS